MHAPAGSRFHRGRTNVVGAVVFNMAQATPRRRRRLEHSVHSAVVGQCVLGIGVLQQERSTTERPQTRADLAWRHLPVPMAVRNRNISSDCLDGLRHCLRLLGFPGHRFTLAEHVLLADIATQRLPRRQDVQDQERRVLRLDCSRLHLLLR